MEILWLLVAFAVGEQSNDPQAEEELTDQEKFAQEILSLFNYPVYTGMI